VDANLMDFPLAMHISQTTLDTVLLDLVKTLKFYGVRKVVLVNSHGGNDFTPFVRQTQADLDVHIFVCNWWTVGSDVYGDIFEHSEDHAGEMETSTMLHLRPELVELETAKDGAAKPFRFEALNKGWVKTSRRFANLNDHCAVGDPRQATAEKGAKYFDLVCGRLGDFLAELAEAEIDDAFPH
jgi:creatinine amidohydrolase